MSLMYEELLSSEKALSRVLSTNKAVTEEIARQAKSKAIQSIVTVARGTSNNAAAFFKYICEQNNGLMVSRFNHSVTTILGSTPIMTNSLVIGISQSGASTDTIKVMQKALDSGALTVAVTNDKSSPLAKMCDYHLYLNCGEEKSVAATKTFTLQLAVLELLARALCGDVAPDFESIRVDLNALTLRLDELKALASKTKDIDNMLILSRGSMLCVADEMSLKLIETCYKMSRSYSVAEFAHGPYALIDKERTVILLAPDGAYKNDFIAIAERIAGDGGKIISFTDIPKVKALSRYSFNMPQSTVSQIYLYTLAIQAYAAFLSEVSGINPDMPRGLAKVTITL
ncbi:MAG: SIS domain-containing protein [Clostridia bacterium]|nr:SIS domain-containing protein [Clostridia bacterium]